MSVRRKKDYLWGGLAVFLTVCAILLVYDTLFGSRAAVTLFGVLATALRPIVYGALIAYLLAPVINFFEELLFPEQVKKAKREGLHCAALPRAVSLLITWVIVALLCYMLLSVLLPELYRSIVQLWNNLELYYNTINRWLMNLLEKNPAAETFVTDAFAGYYKDLLDFLTDKVLPQTQQLVTAVSGGVLSALIFLKNLVVGIIVSVYLLATKERCAAHSRQLVYGVLPESKVLWFFRGLHRADGIFSGFVRGKLLDSLIIGVLCFIGCSVLNTPYTPLISTIVGVTNIIPFFGPFLGAIPSIFLILLVKPIQAVYFLIFVLALQQLDGNIIGPKILGDSTGLSGLWVIIAILVGGGLFGVAGMFFGVPICACLLALGSFLVESSLKRKGLPTSSQAYHTDTPAASNPPEKAP